jgi:hypothetical protein
LLVALAGCHKVFGLADLRDTPDAAPSIDATVRWRIPQVVVFPITGTAFATDVTLTADETRILYSVGSTYDIFEATLAETAVTNPKAVAATAAVELSPELSVDGLSLWSQVQETPGIGAIQLRTRTIVGAAWSAPSIPMDLERVGKDDRPGSPDASARYMVISRSNRLVEMQRPGTTWTEMPTCARINTMLADARDPQLSPDGLRLVMTGALVAGPNELDLWQSTRDELGAEWGEPTKIIELSVPGDDDSDPWMSADGMRIWFNRGLTVLYSEFR